MRARDDLGENSGVSSNSAWRCCTFGFTGGKLLIDITDDHDGDTHNRTWPPMEGVSICRFCRSSRGDDRGLLIRSGDVG